MTPHPEVDRLAHPFAGRRRCAYCRAPLEALEDAAFHGVCGRLECQAASWSQRSRERHAARTAAAIAHLRTLARNPETSSWSLTPANPAVLVELASSRRDAFLKHLEQVVAEALADPIPSAAPRPVRDPPPRSAAEGDALGTACATCRGSCCREGGTHAFLNADTLRRVWSESPDLEPAATFDLYASSLGSHHLEGGCVFQGERGCRLPRSLRSDTCNRWLCPDLRKVRKVWMERGGAIAPHTFVAIAEAGDEVLGSRDLVSSE